MSFDEVKKFLEDWSKSSFLAKTIEEFNNQTKQSWDKFAGILEAAKADVTQRNIEVKTDGSKDAEFKTIIALNGDITNEFPAERPAADDVYWKRHKELVDEAMATRKELSIKVIEIVGDTIKGVINPISVSSVDLAKIIEEILAKKK